MGISRVSGICVAALFALVTSAAWGAPATAEPVFKQYCVGCHGKSAAAGLNLQTLFASDATIATQFQKWEKVAAALETRHMPPAKMPQPSDAERSGAVDWVRTKLSAYAEKHAGDPGRVTMRRLTSGEYLYAVRDLTGLDFKLDREFATDAVGGEGFTNFGDVQFMGDGNLERYLETAKRIADHAVVGAGPLQFYDDPGKSGFELSAIHRINDIYRKHGFRANSGEGGKPYGMEKYTDAFYACWRYANRAVLGEGDKTLEAIAKANGVSPRFAKHLWTVMHNEAAQYPATEAIAKWKAMPVAIPGKVAESETAAKAAAADVMRAVVDWPRWFFAAGAVAEGGEGDERSLVLSEENLTPKLKYKFKYPTRQKGAKVFLGVVPVNANAASKPTVVWRNAMVRVRGKDRATGQPQPLKTVLDAETIARLGLDKGDDIVTHGEATVPIAMKLPEGSFGVELNIDAEIGPEGAGDAVLRTTISDNAEVSKGRPMWVLLGDASNAGYKKWKAGVEEFARVLPQNSQGEADPADKDPIPAPWNNTYNQPERDRFHQQIKYYRTDEFLYQNILDDATRVKLEQAWADLKSSFEYHDLFLKFVVEKYKLRLSDPKIARLNEAEIAAIPAEPRQYVAALKTEYDDIQKRLRAARAGHVEDTLKFASMAWRRPLSKSEETMLRGFYQKARTGPEVDHDKAVRMLLARVLVAPSFMYRLEQPATDSGVKALSDWELASRLSFFLWSSVPDAELRRAAAAGELRDEAKLQAQVKRMVADEKARRFATEFFGQWLGFYRFDQSKGVDTTRFPEFTEAVKTAMYDEAVSFFEHIVRKERPVREMFTADYTFLNKPLAKHYGITKGAPAGDDVVKVDGATEFHRGGVLRLGAVLTATSAPLRTSPVKRGDWVLRRILGTPTPPPPADAGSIPADDKLFAGLTVKEKLAAHQRNATCAACHSRIDPLGFPFEHFDSVGRWRATYNEGKPINDEGELKDKTKLPGVEGLMAYLKTQEPQVVKTMAYKMLGYALGRTVLASDQPLIDKLTKEGGDITVSKLASEIVMSKQFRFRRERDETTPPPSPEPSAAAVRSRKTEREGGL